MFFLIITYGLFITIFALVSLGYVTGLTTRVKPINILIYAICFFITSDWVVEQFSLLLAPIYDVLFVTSVPIFILLLLRKRTLMKSRSLRILIGVYLAFQLWFLVGLFAHSGLGLQPIWAWYRRGLITFVFLLTGIVLATRPYYVQRNAYKFLLLAFMLEATIGVIQTVSGGTVFVDRYSGRYVGYLTSLPVSMRSERREQATGAGSADNGFYAGGVFRASGTHLQSNWFAVSMIGGLSLSLGLYIDKRKEVRRTRFLAILALGFTLLALVLSVTRTGYLAFFILLLWIWFYWQPLSGKILTAVKVVLGTLVVVPLLVVLIASFGGNFSVGRGLATRLQEVRNPMQSPSVQWRIELWGFAWNRIKGSPLTGIEDPIYFHEVFPGNYAIATPIEAPLHNQFVSSVYHGGIPLGILYILTNIWLIWRTMISPARIRRSAEKLLWVVPANLCFIGYLIEGIGIDWMNGISLPGLYWLLAGASFSSIYMAGRETAQVPQQVVQPQQQLITSPGHASQSL